MPTYEYHCTECGQKTEALQKITDKPLEECPSCHKKALKRGPGGGIGLSFTGTGFYETDYKPKPPENGGGGGGCCPCGKNKSCS